VPTVEEQLTAVLLMFWNVQLGEVVDVCPLPMGPLMLLDPIAGSNAIPSTSSELACVTLDAKP
jgi:hypothetical protein